MTQKEFNNEYSEYSYEDLDELIHLAGKRMTQLESEPPDYDAINDERIIAQARDNGFIDD